MDIYQKQLQGLSSIDTFQKFSHDYLQKFKNNQEKQQNSLKSQNVYQLPNSKTSGNTWDAKHLDKFIEKNDYTSQSIYLKYQPKEIDERELYNNVKVKNHFTRSMSLPKFYNDLNQQAMDKDLKQNPQNYYERQFKIIDKQFDKELLNLPIDQKLCSSRDQQKEYQKNLENLRNYSKWKNNFNQASKSLKVHKMWHKSGILQVDNPESKNTCIYKEENEKLRQNQENQIRQQKAKSQYLKEKQSCNKDIEFFNKNETNQKQPKIEHYQDKWKIKNRLSNVPIDTKNRIFGIYNIPFKQKRAQKLFQEQNHVKYNIINQGELQTQIIPNS